MKEARIKLILTPVSGEKRKKVKEGDLMMLDQVKEELNAIDGGLSHINFDVRLYCIKCDDYFRSKADVESIQKTYMCTYCFEDI